MPTAMAMCWRWATAPGWKTRSRRWPAIIERLFVYGTLLAATDTPMARWLAPHLRNGRQATVSGRLIAIATGRGFYPALLPARSQDRVHGMVFDVALSRADRGRLDRYEGTEYRCQSTVALAGHARLRARLYRWTAPLPPCARPIAGGDFRRWLAAGGRRAYGQC